MVAARAGSDQISKKKKKKKNKKTQQLRQTNSIDLLLQRRLTEATTFPKFEIPTQEKSKDNQDICLECLKEYPETKPLGFW